MSRNKKSILIVLVILLAALGIYFLFKDDHHEKGSAKSDGPAMEFSNIEMKAGRGIRSVSVSRSIMKRPGIRRRIS